MSRLPVVAIGRGLRDQVVLSLASRLDDRPWLRRRLVARTSQRLQRWAATAADPAAALHAAEASRWSQNGEDGLIAALVAAVGAPSRTFVEIGSSDGEENCTRALAEDGWRGVWFEADPDRAAKAAGVAERLDVQVRQATITSGNVASLLAEVEVPAEPDVLVLDIDGSDMWVLRALLERCSPRILVAEYNSTFPPGTFWTRRNRATYEWDETYRHGASLDAMAWAAGGSGYRLVACDSMGVNAFFVRGDLLDGTDLPDAPLAELYRPLLIRPPLIGHPWHHAAPSPVLEGAELSQVGLRSVTVRWRREPHRWPGATALGVDVEVVNDTGKALTSGGPNPLVLSARLLDADGAPIAHECIRNLLIGGVPAKGAVPATALVDAVAGTHTVRVCLVQDGIAWLDGGAVDIPLRGA